MVPLRSPLRAIQPSTSHAFLGVLLIAMLGVFIGTLIVVSRYAAYG